MKILGIIPARGNSKEIPKKNIVLLDGKPLLAYTINLLKACKSIDSFVVSTESDEIAKVAKEYSAPVLKRPDYLSRDDSSVADVVRHVAHELPHYKLYVTVYPTVPLCIPSDVDMAVNKLVNSDYESLVSIVSATIHPYGGYSISGDDLVTNIENQKIYRRQDMRPLYQATGGPFIVRKEYLDKLGNNLYTEHKTFFLIPKERAIDIDEEIDLKFAEFLLKTNQMH
jgi:CMP-N-acetylneuraminic acid synthetase